MAQYVILESMKRHERSALCMKLFNEMYHSHKLAYLVMPLGKRLDQFKKGRNILKNKKEQPYAITASTYKGLSFFIIAFPDLPVEIIFNTSPIDACYVEFTKIAATSNLNTIVFTQHTLDRYNERVHHRKYTNYKDIMKRLVVNNPNRSRIQGGNSHKVAWKLHEGFLLGSVDKVHKNIIINTFFDREEFQDNKLLGRARSFYNCVEKLSPVEYDIVSRLSQQFSEGKINKQELEIKMIHEIMQHYSGKGGRA